MLQNAYFLAKIGVDTAENEQHFAELGRKRRGSAASAGRAKRSAAKARIADAGGARSSRRFNIFRLAKLGKLAKILQIFGGLVLGCIKTKFCKKICV